MCSCADKTKGDRYPSPTTSSGSSQKDLRHFNDNARYEDVRRACLRSGRPWEDPDFAASNRNLVTGDSTSSIFTYSGGYGGLSASSIQWLRPAVSGDVLHRGPRRDCKSDKVT